MSVSENKKLAIISKELQREMKNFEQLKIIPQEINLIEKETKNKIQKIKVNVLNIDFSLQEIFS